MKLAIVGATGLVGRTILEVMEERQFFPEVLYLAASGNSVGKTLHFRDDDIKVRAVKDIIDLKPDFAIFSAGGSFSKMFASKFTDAGIVVVDNSSAWRMDPKVPLIVPEINMDSIKSDNKIIANPNCSTIQVVMALHELHKEFQIKRLIISTYQSVSGSGKHAINQLEAERYGEDIDKVYPYEIDLNCIPQGGAFLDNGYTEEEMKLVKETRKILNDQSIGITATVVRVPVVGGHSASINVEFEKPIEMKRIWEILENSEGVMIMDDPSEEVYPMPKFAEGYDDVFVGRLRIDPSVKNGLNMWVVADNLRKGAATNAIQIVEKLSAQQNKS